MTRPQHPSGLSEIASQYDTILCDVWGVVHNGRSAFEPACEALTRFREQGGTVILITNAPVPKEQVISYFKPMGVPDSCFDDCVSSGDATRDELKKRAGEKVWRLGVDGGVVGGGLVVGGVVVGGVVVGGVVVGGVVVGGVVVGGVVVGGVVAGATCSSTVSENSQKLSSNPV